MSTPKAVIAYSNKSFGKAVLLVLLFGPIGLFYSTVIGGIVMTILIPIAFLIIVFVSQSLLLIIFLSIAYYIALFIVAWNGVHVHNEKIVRKVNKINREGRINEMESIPIITDTEIANNNSNVPTYQEWLVLNPNNSINDYYKIYNLRAASIDNNINYKVEKVENKSYSLIWIILGLIIITMILFMSINKTGKLSFANMLNSENKEKEAIKNQIENTYFGLVNGAYTAQSLSGTTPEKLPFYNSDISTLMIMGLTPLGMVSGPISIEPKNIVINDVNDSLADVNYDLVLENKTSSIHMIMKKIGGNWKLDGQKIFPKKVGKKNKKRKSKRYY